MRQEPTSGKVYHTVQPAEQTGYFSVLFLRKVKKSDFIYPKTIFGVVMIDSF